MLATSTVFLVGTVCQQCDCSQHPRCATDPGGLESVRTGRIRSDARADEWSSSRAFPTSLRLRPDDVHVVRIRLDRTVDVTSLSRILDDNERRRASRCVYDRDRRRFVIAHGLTRVLLSRCLQRPPDALRFDTNPYGKPLLRDPSSGLRFNLSHAGDVALLAISSGRELGVDVEQMRPLAVLDLSRQFFSPNEHTTLCAWPPDGRDQAFFRCWTRKESFIKALGRGLNFPLDGFEVRVDEDGSPVLHSCDSAPGELDRWTIISLRIDPGYSAALTVEGRSPSILCWAEPENLAHELPLSALYFAEE
jgi:4'-phosphopantetheinyl transferase